MIQSLTPPLPLTFLFFYSIPFTNPPIFLNSKFITLYLSFFHDLSIFLIFPSWPLSLSLSSSVFYVYHYFLIIMQPFPLFPSYASSLSLSPLSHSLFFFFLFLFCNFFFFSFLFLHLLLLLLLILLHDVFKTQSMSVISSIRISFPTER